MPPKLSHRCYIGFDPTELRAGNVAAQSMKARSDPRALDVHYVSRLSLHEVYTRPTTRMPNGQLFDVLSGAPMSTNHAIARFFVPWLCQYQGWALFTDGDILVREDIRHLFALADPQYAVQVVQHPPQLEEGLKKADHVQQAYPRKNWSSVMLFHCGHPANAHLTLEVLNSWPGRDLHAFRWLTDDQIGALPDRWNYLVGVTPPTQIDPALVHFTLGCPDVRGHETDPFAGEWWSQAREAGYRRIPEQVGVSSA